MPKTATDAALAACLVALADDELILGHRNSEWCGHAPILEEDIAFANLAQDELGHAALWYRLVESLTGQTPDHLVFFRAAADYRCAPFVEWPKGDWAFSMLRQYLFDAAESVRLPLLAESAHPGVRDTAAKIRTEEIYHLRHTRAWVRRLGLGTDESQRRMQAALDALWPLAPQLFAHAPGDASLAAAGLVPPPTVVQRAWEHEVRPFLAESGLVVPAASQPPTASREAHSPYLADLLAEMQSVARLEDETVQW